MTFVVCTPKKNPTTSKTQRMKLPQAYQLSANFTLCPLHYDIVSHRFPLICRSFGKHISSSATNAARHLRSRFTVLRSNLMARFGNMSFGLYPMSCPLHRLYSVGERGAFKHQKSEFQEFVHNCIRLENYNNYRHHRSAALTLPNFKVRPSERETIRTLWNNWVRVGVREKTQKFAKLKFVVFNLLRSLLFSLLAARALRIRES